ncbi:DUF3842 family protein [Lachnospiraceae bacterium NSJ-143]|nr:DUF3842 family protein [Lachnospiraceae bacterium NSJ-143]
MIIMVVDGQGGGMGKALIEKIKPSLGPENMLIALGTNSIATANMIKAGADKAATGENAIKVNAAKADIIVGSIGIISSNSMFGELSHEMARAISESPAEKVLIPIKRCGICVVGVNIDSMPRLIDEAANICIDIVRQRKGNCPI